MKNRFSIFIFLLLFFVGKTISAQSVYTYNPKLPTDVKTVTEAKKKIITILSEANNLNISGAKVEKISFTDDEIDFDLRKKDNKIIYYKDLLNGIPPITVNAPGDVILWTKTPNGTQGVIFISGTLSVMQQIADYFLYIQNDVVLQKEREEELKFEPLATKYRSLTVKPEMSEEQRKFIVQANAMTQKKLYTSAIELYKKALEVSATDCPDAYSNMALLEAQIGNYKKAISSMKKYLKLVPEAEDARSAQDKIYEWEINVTSDGNAQKKEEMMNKKAEMMRRFN